MTIPKKKQIAKLSKRQQGFNIGQQIVGLLSNLARDVKQVMEKGTMGNGQPLPCSVADVKSTLTPDQLGGIEEFISNWYVEPEPPPSPPKPPRSPGKK